MELPGRKKRQRDYSDVSTVESQKNDLTAEEFPEGPYGASIPVESLGKSSPWQDGQRAANPFSYENRKLHEDLPRVYPFADPIHGYEFSYDHLSNDSDNKDNAEEK